MEAAKRENLFSVLQVCVWIVCEEDGRSTDGGWRWDLVCTLKARTPPLSAAVSSPAPLIHPNLTYRIFCLTISCLLGNKVISHLLLTEPAPLMANEDESTNDSSLRTLLTLCDLLNRELLVLIGWAKQIPGTNTSSVSFFLPYI